MAADSPWIKWWTDDFLMGVIDLAADEVGVYVVLLNLMASRGGPIPDDRRWLSRRCGTTTRRFNQIVDHLTDLDKLWHRDGMIGNRRMLAEIDHRNSKSGQARSAAMHRWHEGQEELDLDQSAPRPDARAHGQRKTERKSARKTKDNLEIISPKNQPKPQKPANKAHATASPPVRARARSSEDSDSTHPNSSTNTGRLGNADLKQLYDAVCDAAGFNPFDPSAIDRAMTQVEDWKRLGYDFDAVVVPAIRAVVAMSGPDDRTRTLGRFRHAVAREAARAAESASNGRAHQPTVAAEPLLEPEGEEETFRPIRKKLLETLGAPAYCMAFNRVRFEDVGETSGRRPIRVKGDSYLTEAIRHGSWRPVLIKAAKAHGFNEVW